MWTGAINYFMFYETFSITLEQGLTAAWYEGSAMCGILPEEMSLEEAMTLRYKIAEQRQYINGFADAIEAGSKENKGKLTPLLQRAQLWANRYNDVRNEAKLMACRDQKLRWDLGSTIQHCSDCLSYSGRVYRASTWRRHDIRPQHPGLECQGFKCGCQFVPTDELATRGRPPLMSGRI